MSRNLFGMHDPGDWENLVREANREAWCIHTEAIGCDPRDTSGKNFSSPGITPIVRLNNGYGSSGTIPTSPNYLDFAQRCANFVAASTGCRHWIIGNEISMEWEWPDGRQISLTDYCTCYDLTYAAIHRVQPDAIVMPQAPATWNNNLKYDGNPDGAWDRQLTHMLERVKNVDAIALHAYTHGHDPMLISSEAKMDPPFHNHHFQFRVYRDFMDAIPLRHRNLPVFITEANPDGWQDVNNGWIQAAYLEIDRWNRDNPSRQISCLAFYRWPDEDQDKFHIGSKPGVVADFRAALAYDYAPIKVDLSQATRIKALTTLNVRLTPGTSNKDDYDVIGSFVEGRIVQLMEDDPVNRDGFTWRRVVTVESPAFTGWIAVSANSGLQMAQVLP